MTLYYFTALGNNGYYSFNPATDKLIFNVPFVTAADVSLAMLAGGSTRFSVLGKTFTMGGFGLDEVTLSNVLFISGAGVLRVGDNSVGTTGDSYGNAIGGTSGNDKLYGMGGNDSIYGNGGSDVVGGGGGNDLVNGGLGSDTASYFDAAGNVFVNLNFGAQNTGAGGIDTLVSIENVWGGGFNDTLIGNNLANELRGGAGNDYLVGNGGIDTASYATAAAAVRVDLNITTAYQNTLGAGFDRLLSIENVIGGDGNDTLIGNAATNELRGGLGNDSLNGGAGYDVASYVGAKGPVQVNLSLAGYQNTVGAGSDVLVSIEDLRGGSYGDRLIGNSLSNFLYGEIGNDSLYGLAGYDRLTGGAGYDLLVGGAGNDTLVGGLAGDVFRFDGALSASTNKDTISDFSVVDDRIQLENAVFTVLPGGALSASDFANVYNVGATATVAASVNVVYDRYTGNLYYDPSGGTPTGRVLFATLTGSPDGVVASDFQVT